VTPSAADKRDREPGDQTPESFGLTRAAILVSRTPDRVGAKKSRPRRGGKPAPPKGSI
jgi:hypothetical protein